MFRQESIITVKILTLLSIVAYGRCFLEGCSSGGSENRRRRAWSVHLRRRHACDEASQMCVKECGNGDLDFCGVVTGILWQCQSAWCPKSGFTWTWTLPPGDVHLNPDCKCPRDCWLAGRYNDDLVYRCVNVSAIFLTVMVAFNSLVVGGLVLLAGVCQSFILHEWRRHGRSIDEEATGDAHLLKAEDDDLSHRWPYGVVPYAIQDDVDQKVRDAIDQSIAEFNEKTCVRFVPRSDEESYITVVNGDKCYATVGRFGAQEVKMAHNCGNSGTAAHELMHVLGFGHEHNRPDRDDYVEIVWENIKSSEKSNFQIEAVSRSMVDAYDYESVMHYAPDAFSKHPGFLQTIRLKEKVDSPTKVGQRSGLSDLDVQKINNFYMCDGETSNAEEVLPSCVFGDDRHFDGETWSSGTPYVLQCFAFINGTRIVRPVACLTDTGERKEDGERWPIMGGAFIMQCRIVPEGQENAGWAEIDIVACVAPDGRQVEVGETWYEKSYGGDFGFVYQCQRSERGVSSAPVSCRFSGPNGDAADIGMGCFRQYAGRFVYCLQSGASEYSIGSRSFPPGNGQPC